MKFVVDICRSLDHIRSIMIYLVHSRVRISAHSASNSQVSHGTSDTSAPGCEMSRQTPLPYSKLLSMFSPPVRDYDKNTSWMKWGTQQSHDNSPFLVDQPWSETAHWLAVRSQLSVKLLSFRLCSLTDNADNMLIVGMFINMPMSVLQHDQPSKRPSAATRASRAPGHKRQLWLSKSSNPKVSQRILSDIASPLPSSRVASCHNTSHNVDDVWWCLMSLSNWRAWSPS